MMMTSAPCKCLPSGLSGLAARSVAPAFPLAGGTGGSLGRAKTQRG